MNTTTLRTMAVALAVGFASISSPTSARTSHHGGYPGSTRNHAWHSRAVALPYGAVTSTPAIRGGQVVGADPDANVRFELERDNRFY